MHANLWNSFIERKFISTTVRTKKWSLHKIYNLYQRINDRMKYWSHHYNTLSGDASHNKSLVVQSINKEFYNNKEAISGIDYQYLLMHSTYFDPQDWDVYKNNGGFYLLIPKKYSAQHSLVGFKLIL